MAVDVAKGAATARTVRRTRIHAALVAALPIVDTVIIPVALGGRSA